MLEMPEFLTDLERAILDFSLPEAGENEEVLRQQIAMSKLASREHTGYGFFTNFRIDEDSPRCSVSNFQFGNVTAVVSGELCGFWIFVREGEISFLEGFPLGGDSWPSSEVIEKVSKIK